MLTVVGFSVFYLLIFINKIIDKTLLIIAFIFILVAF